MQKRFHIGKRAGLFFSTSFALLSLHAAVLYDTYGPDPYTPNIPYFTPGWGYDSGSGLGGATGYAAPFSFTGMAYQLNSITLDIGRDFEATPNLQIAFYADDGGQPALTPFALLEPNPTLTTALRQSITYDLSGTTILDPDAPYWMAVQPRVIGVPVEDYNVQYTISSSSLPPMLPVARRDAVAGQWGDWTIFPNHLQPVFRLDGTAVPVPEPSTWALLGLGSALFWCAARRRKK